MNKLGNRNYTLISMGAKVCGTLKPNECMAYCMEEFYVNEYDEIESFLRWCHEKNKPFGHGNYEERFTEFKTWEKDIKQKWNKMQNQPDPEAEKWWYCNGCGGRAKAKNMRIVFGELTCPRCAKEMGEKGSPAYIG